MSDDSANQQVDESADHLFAYYMDRLIAGELVDLYEVKRQHPDLGEEVIEQLRSFCELADDSSEMGRHRRVGDFELIREIGRGGMGIVYEATQISLGRRVALKILPSGFSADAKTVARFIREAQISAKLDHPNVVTVFEMGIDEHVPYYAMEYVEGDTLSQKIDWLRASKAANELMNRQYYLDLARRFVEGAEGLSHAHRRGVVHRDLKPSNLIFDTNKKARDLLSGTLRILDFGLARLDGQDTLTASGDVVGSVHYMSPEQAKSLGEKNVDERSDIYSLGATLYEALTLHPPHKGNDIQHTLRLIQSKEPVPPKRLNARVPRDLETITMKCLRKIPGDRYSTAEAFAQDLNRFVRGDHIEAKPPTTGERAARWIQRHRVMTSIIMGISVIAAMTISWWHNVLLDANRKLAIAEKAAKTKTLENDRLNYSFSIAKGAKALRSVPISIIEASPCDVYLLPAGHRFYVGKDWIASPKPTGLATLQKAINELSAAITLIPDRPGAYLHRARAHIMNHDLAAASNDLDQLLKYDPNHLLGWLLKMQLSGKSEQSKIAERIEAIAADNEIYRLWRNAQDLAQRRHYEEAVVSFQEALQKSKDKEPYIGWSEEVELALAICLRSAGRYAESLTYLRGTSPEVLVQQAITCYGLGGESVAVADKIFADLLSQTDNESIALLVLQEYRRLFARGKVETLNWSFIDRWLGRIPTDPLRLRILALFHLHSGNIDKGIQAAEDALKAAPNDAAGYFFLAEDALIEHNGPGGIERKVSMMQRAVELQPEDLEYRSALVYWLCRLDRVSDAKKHLDILEQKAENELGYWPTINLAGTYGQFGEFDRANQLFDQADFIQRNGWTEFNRGLMYRLHARNPANPEDARRRHWEKAVQAYEKSLEVNPRLPYSYAAIAAALRALGRETEAHTYMEKSWVMAGKREATARWLGHYHYQRNELADAGSWFLEALQRNRGDKENHNPLREILSSAKTDGVATIAYRIVGEFKTVLATASDEDVMPTAVRLRTIVTLAIAYEAIGDQGQAKQHWQEASTIIMRHGNLEPEAALIAEHAN